MKLGKFWPLFLFVAAAALCAIVFSGSWSLTNVLVGPDGFPDISRPSFLRRAIDWAMSSSSCFHHDEFLKLILPTLAYHEISYLLCTALTALTLCVYLRGLGLTVAACCGGGIALAFSGYGFTLFHAGHRGYFIMLPYAVFAFALIDDFIRKPNVPAAVLLAACAACGLSAQPDVAAFFFLLLFCYAVFRLAESIRAEGGARWFKARKFPLFIAVPALIAAAACFGFGTLRHVFTDIVGGRDAQLEAATDAPKAGHSSEKSDENWTFCTDWSLPPEDMLEFVAACPRGYETGHVKGPYWGRLGQSAGFEKDGAGFPNFRQHSLYLGAAPVSFAVFAIVCAFVRRKKDPLSAVTFFWAVAALVCLLLAFGRYTPVYRAFYALPMMDKVRCPVKFVHLLELSTAVLFAIGIARLPAKRNDDDDTKKARAVSSKITLAVLALGAIALVVAAHAFDPYARAAVWHKMGLLSGDAETDRFICNAFAARYSDSLVTAAWLVALSAMMIVAGPYVTGKRSPAVMKDGKFNPAWVVVALCAIDLVRAALPFAATEDVSARYETNPAATALLKAVPAPDGYSFSYLYLTQRPITERAFGPLSGMEGAGFTSADPWATDAPDSARVFAMTSFGNDFQKRWNVLGTAGIFLAPDAARALVQSGLVKLIATFDIDRTGRLRPPADIRAPSLALAVPAAKVQPPLGVYHAFRTAPEDVKETFEMLAQKDFDVTREIAVAGDIALASTNLPPDRATWLTPPSRTDRTKALVKAEASAPGYLLVREWRLRRYRALKATVNGKSAPVLRANGIFFAVPVPAGESEITLAPDVKWTGFAVSFAGFFLVAATLCIWCRRRIGRAA